MEIPEKIPTLSDIWKEIKGIPGTILSSLFSWIATGISWILEAVASFIDTLALFVYTLLGGVLGTGSDVWTASLAVVWASVVIVGMMLIIRIYRMVLDLLPLA